MVPADSVCLSPSDASKLVVELDRVDIISQMNDKIEEQNNQLTNQTEILKEQVELLQKKFDLANNLIQQNEDLHKAKEEALEKDLKEASKPKWKSMLLSAGVGGVIVLILKLLVTGALL
jgi:small-conductance mechanosensitive channel